jgi:hypothetical protein
VVDDLDAAHRPGDGDRVGAGARAQVEPPADRLEPATAAEPIELVEMCDVVDRHSTDDRFVTTWRSFDRVSAGRAIARRANGEEVVAPMDGYIVFPSPNAVPGREWFYFARPGNRR